MKYRAEIDGLRALAVLPVILFHAGFELFSGGYVGVDVFFVISGYLITSILIEDIEKNRFSIIHFYERRARRILPALFFVMFACIPFAILWMLPNQMEDFSLSLIAVSLFVSNILFWRQSGYFAPAAEEMPLLHTWSLAVEEQYYLLFPIFLILAWRFGKKGVFWMIIVIGVVSLFLSEWGWRNQEAANFYLAPTRAWELLAGSVTAFIVQKKGVQKHNLLALFGLASIFLSIFLYDETTPFPSVFALVPVLGVVLLILFANKETWAAKLLSAKVLVGIGLISYSTYLWHQPLFAFARIRLSEHPSSALMLLLSMTSIILAYLSWRFVEKPFRQRNITSRRTIFSGSLVGLCCFLFIGYQGYLNNGFEDKLLNTQELAVYKSTKRSNEPNCEHGVDKCFELMSDGENGVVLLLGDSNAEHFSTSLRNLADEMSYNYIQLTYNGCLPLANFNRLEKSPGFNQNCKSFNHEVRENLNFHEKNIDVIVVSAAWLLYYYGSDLLETTANFNKHPISNIRLSHNGKTEIEENERDEIFGNYFKALFTLLKKSANKVIVVGPLPPSIVKFNHKNSLFSPNLLSSSEFFNSTSSFNLVFDNAVNEANISFIDLAKELCNKDVCSVMRNEMYLYGDPTHLSNYGQSRIMAPLFRNEFLNIGFNN
tara:strand:- start:374 stop:2341 length:1968 start_codon:yes stop_codon:yes gene_type:complete